MAHSVGQAEWFSKVARNHLADRLGIKTFPMTLRNLNIISSITIIMPSRLALLVGKISPLSILQTETTFHLLLGDLFWHSFDFENYSRNIWILLNQIWLIITGTHNALESVIFHTFKLLLAYSLCHLILINPAEVSCFNDRKQRH